MRTLYAILADAVVVLHVAYVTFIIVGLVLILVGWWRNWQWVRNFWFRALHLTMIMVVVVEALLGIVCPLTTWEKGLRRLSGEATYTGSFLGRWAHEILFFELPPWIFTVIYCLFGALVLAVCWLVPPRRNSAGNRDARRHDAAA